MKKPTPSHLDYSRGQLAAAVDCGPETIRYYEQIGLLPEPRRTANGYRIYGDDTRKRLSFVLRLRGLGFTIEEIENVCALLDNNTYTCGDIHNVALEHLEAVRTKIRELQKMQRQLKSLVGLCGQGELPDCPIIDTLYI